MEAATIDLTQLPTEVVFDILITLSINDILERCRTSKFFNDICSNEVFWRAYARHHGVPLKEGTSARQSVSDVAFIRKQIPARNDEEKQIFIHKGIPNKIQYKIEGTVLRITFYTTINIPELNFPTAMMREIENKLVRYGGQVTINKKGIVRIKLTVTVVNPDEHFKEQYGTEANFIKEQRDTLIRDALYMYISGVDEHI